MATVICVHRKEKDDGKSSDKWLGKNRASRT